MVNLPTKFEVSTFSHYGDMKCVKNAQNGGCLGWLGVTQVHRQCHAPFGIAHAISYSSLIETMRLFVPFSRYGELFVEIRQLDLPHLHLAPPLGVTPFEFRKKILGVRKLESLVSIIRRCLRHPTFIRLSTPLLAKSR